MIRHDYKPRPIIKADWVGWVLELLCVAFVVILICVRW
jgi:hypothetical protein